MSLAKGVKQDMNKARELYKQGVKAEILEAIACEAVTILPNFTKKA
jgi:hypothetical protein